MNVILLRHGKTAGNLQHRYVGRTDEALCETGAWELRQMFDRKKWDCGQERLVIVSSPMKRCRQTVQLLANANSWRVTSEGLCVDKVLLEIDKDLREMDFGDFEYKNYEELKDAPDYLRYIACGGAMGFPHGEPLDAFKKRCVDAFARNVLRFDKQGVQNMFFVVHGGTIMAVLEHFSKPHHDFFCWQAKNGHGFQMIIKEECLKACEQELYLEKIRPL